jgi:virginiamycin B lyase
LVQIERLESRCLMSLTVNEFQDGFGPEGIVSGPDGNLWFTENGSSFASGNKIALIKPTTHAISEFATPTSKSRPAGITAGPDGNVYFTEQQAGSIGEINLTTHAITEFPTPTPDSVPLGITAGPDGNLWFTESFSTSSHGGQIGQFNPSSHAIAEFPIPTANGLPAFITPGPDGNLWFTEGKGNSIVQINPTTHVITEFPVPTANSFPQGITSGPDGNLWFTEVSGNKIGRINPTTHAITEFPIPTANSVPELITLGPDGNLWFAENNANKIGQINPTTQAIAEVVVPTSASAPVGITSGPDGNVWFTEFAGNKIGQIVLRAPVTAPDLALSGNAPGSVTPGSNVTYLLTVTNSGTASATGVTLTDTLPAGVTFVSATDGVTPVGNVLSFPIGNLAAHASTSVTAVVTPRAAGILRNTASVEANESDPTPADNSITQTTTVSAAPTVTGVQRFGFHAQATALVLSFDTQLDPERAQDPHNYQIVALEGSRRRIRIKRAVYDSATRTVTLSPVLRLNLHNRFRLTVIGTGHGGVTDISGNLLDGQSNGDPGTNFVTLVTAADLVLITTDPAILRAYKKILFDQGEHLGAVSSHHRR